MEITEAKVVEGFLCLIGDPVSHSLSPAIYNGFFKEEGINALYFALKVKKEDLKRVIRLFRRLEIVGFNITMPHKLSITRLLDRVDPLAESIRAVNTVVVKDGEFIGYNTDALGLRAILQDWNFSRAQRALLVGAGGYARAVAHVIADFVEELLIVSKSGVTASNLASEVKEKYGIHAKGFKAAEAWNNTAGQFDIIVNASPVGMKDPSAIPLPSRLLKRGCLVVDAVYDPLETRLLREAKRRGCRVIDGLWLLSYQAAKNIELWFKRRADPVRLRSIALEAIEDG